MVVISSAKPTKLALQFIFDEKVYATLIATGEKKLEVEYLLDLVDNILLTVTDVQVHTLENFTKHALDMPHGIKSMPKQLHVIHM